MVRIAPYTLCRIVRQTTLPSLLVLVVVVSAASAQPAPASVPEVHVNVAPPTSAADGASADSASALAAKFQNPIADLVSFPLQNNTNFDVGPHRGTQDILNIQPVIPIHLSDDWNMITRTILPLVWSPSFQPIASAPPFGLAPTTFSAFFSPRGSGAVTWGAGPIVQLPTGTNKALGSNVWGGGPAAVVVVTQRPWVYGILVNNVFSFGGTSGPVGTRYSLMTINPFVNYNFGGGWFAGSVPILTASWDSPGQKWTLPIGGQVGRLIKIGGKLPVNLLVGAYYNALRPAGGATWQLRTQIAFIF
jgi:hypothetical protein